MRASPEEEPRRGRLVVVGLIAAAVLYGASYQQFKHFDLDDPRGFSDARNYIEMSHGNYQVSIKHRHRFLIPVAAGVVNRALTPLTPDPLLRDRLAFYIVNFAVIWATALLLFLVLERLGLAWPLSLLGMAAFLSSRFTVASAALPLVDSGYFLAIAVITWLTLEGRFLALASIMPLLVLTKETIFPFVLLPFIERSMRKPALAVSVAASFGLVAFARGRILAMSPGEAGRIGNDGFGDVVMERIAAIPATIAHLFSPAGLHDLQSGFSFFLVFAVLGFWVNHKSRRYEIPAFLLGMPVIAAGFAILNGNLGVMLFAAFVPIVAYALIFIEACFEPAGGE